MKELYIVGGIIVCLIVVFIIALIKVEKKVDECFMQEQRTKECELVLYKYEHRPKNYTTVVPMPVVARVN